MRIRTIHVPIHVTIASTNDMDQVSHPNGEPVFSIRVWAGASVITRHNPSSSGRQAMHGTCERRGSRSWSTVRERSRPSMRSMSTSRLSPWRMQQRCMKGCSGGTRGKGRAESVSPGSGRIVFYSISGVDRTGREKSGGLPRPTQSRRIVLEELCSRRREVAPERLCRISCGGLGISLRNGLSPCFPGGPGRVCWIICGH